MGVVAAATHLQLGQRVAIKVLHDELAGDPAFVERFMREARACAMLKTEHACRASDVGQLPSGAPYLVMELLDGSDLARVIAHAPLPITTAVDYVLQACVALAEAHAAGIVHRDLKPGNLFLVRRPGATFVKVLDFGIAKAVGSDLALTRTAAVLGSPRYMSPEQLRSARDVDLRTDIWALGVILYELVSQRVPFPAESITELAVKVAVDAPLPLAVDPAFATVVWRCLEKPPERRYQTVAELAQALAPFASPAVAGPLAEIAGLSQARSLQPSPPVHTDAFARTAASTQTTLGAAASARLPTRENAPRSRAWIGVVAGAVLAIGGGIAFVSSRHGAVAPPQDAAAVVTAPPPVPVIDAPSVDAAAIAIAPADAAPVRPAHVRAQPHVTRPAQETVATPEPAAAPTGPVPTDKDVSDAFLARDYDRAATLAEQALAVHPNDLDIRKNAAMASCYGKDAARARRHFAKIPESKDKQGMMSLCEDLGVQVWQ